MAEVGSGAHPLGLGRLERLLLRRIVLVALSAGVIGARRVRLVQGARSSPAAGLLGVGVARLHRPRLAQGAVYALVALGYTLVYGILRYQLRPRRGVHGRRVRLVLLRRRL